MTRTLGLIVHALRRRDAGAQIVRGGGLAAAGNVVQFAFDGEQGAVADVLRPHPLDYALFVFHVPGAVDQIKILKHHFDGLQVVVGVHVEHGVVLVVELAVALGAGVIALDQVLEVIVVAAGVAARVHGDETGVLQKARVDQPPLTRKAHRHAIDHVVLEPTVAALQRQVVDCRGRFIGVYRSTHHGHRQRHCLSPAGHERNGGQRGNGGLAHTHDVTVAVDPLQVANKLLHIIDVVVEMEVAFGQRHHAGVFPVGDVDLVVFQHGAHGLAQQRGVMSRQRSDHQHHRLALEFEQGFAVVREALEAAQLAKRFVDLDPLVNRHANAVDIDGVNAELRFFVVFAEPVHQLISRRDALRHRQLGKRPSRVVVNLGGHTGQFGKRLHEGALRFVNLVQHDSREKSDVAVQYNSMHKTLWR